MGHLGDADDDEEGVDQGEKRTVTSSSSVDVHDGQLEWIIVAISARTSSLKSEMEFRENYHELVGNLNKLQHQED